MMGWYRGSWEFPQNFMGFVGIIVAIELTLKGFALWRAAKRDEQYWFVALLVLNTAGILPAVYLLLNQTQKKKG